MAHLAFGFIKRGTRHRNILMWPVGLQAQVAVADERSLVDYRNIIVRKASSKLDHRSSDRGLNAWSVEVEK